MGVLLGSGLPQYHLDFAGSGELSMSRANFGAYDRTSVGISFWLYITDITTRISGIFSHGVSGNYAINVYTTGSATFNKIDFTFTNTGTGLTSRFQTGNVLTINTWQHYYCEWSISGGIQVYKNGSALVADNYTAPPPASLFNSTGNIVWGDEIGGGLNLLGKLYQPAFFSGSFPGAANVYDSGSPRPVRAAAYSVITADGGVATVDGKLSTAWTNSGVTATAGLPS